MLFLAVLIVTVQYEVCHAGLNVSYVLLSFVMCCFWRRHLLLYNVSYVWQCDLLLAI